MSSSCRRSSVRRHLLPRRGADVDGNPTPRATWAGKGVNDVLIMVRYGCEGPTSICAPTGVRSSSVEQGSDMDANPHMLYR